MRIAHHVLSYPYMSGAQDTLYIVLAIAVSWVTVFLCWALYEIATLVRRTNRIVEDVQKRVTQIEHAVESFKEKIANPLTLLSGLAGGGKAVYSLLKNREAKKSSKSSKKKKSELFDDEEEGDE